MRSLLLASILLAASLAAQETGPAVGEALPALDGVDWVQGAPSPEAGFAHRVLVVEFWATWCGPCRAVTPRLVELHGELKGRGLEIVGLSIDKGPAAEKIGDYADQHGIEYRLALAAEMAPAWGVRGIPHAIVVDGQGIVRWRGHPGHPKFAATVRALVEELPPPVSEEEQAADRAEGARLAALGEAALEAAVASLVDELADPARVARSSGVLLAIGPRVRPYLWRVVDEVALTADDRVAIADALDALDADEYDVRVAATERLLAEPRWAGHLLALEATGDPERVARIEFVQETLEGRDRPAWLGSARLAGVGRILGAMSDPEIRESVAARRGSPLWRDLVRVVGEE